MTPLLLVYGSWAARYQGLPGGTQPYNDGVRLYRISDLRYLTLYP